MANETTETYTEEFTFSYTLEGSPRVRTVSVSIEDDGRPFTELSDDASEMAWAKAERLNPGGKIDDLWY